jgi:predicted ArsR family transcriptional regulator
MESELNELDPKTTSFKILCYLTFKDTPLKPQNIAKGLDINSSTVRARLAELKKKGLVTSTNEGYISVSTSYDILMKLFRGPSTD